MDMRIYTKENVSEEYINGLSDAPYLYCEDGVLSLRYRDMSLAGDYSEMQRRLKSANLRSELLVKAAGLKNVEHPRVLDATAGLGEDSLLLAAAGCEVDLYEYNPVIAALLENTLERASHEASLSGIVCHMHLHKADSIKAMGELKEVPDVIYLDPMFPERNKSGLIGKKFQILQKLEAPCMDADKLLGAALRLKPKKIVIKRPLKGENLAGIKPAYSLKGKAVRYDCILPRQIAAPKVP